MDGLDYGNMLQVFGAMLLLVGGLTGFLYLLKRYGPKTGFGSMNRGLISLEGQLSLGPRRSVAVVRCGGKQLVLGVTDNNITLLSQLNGDADFEATLSSQVSQVGRMETEPHG